MKLASGFATFIFFFGFIYGYLVREDQRKLLIEQCHKAGMIIPMSEICEYYGQPKTCQIKHRLMYTYASHKFYACMFGKKGAAWGN